MSEQQITSEGHAIGIFVDISNLGNAVTTNPVDPELTTNQQVRVFSRTRHVCVAAVIKKERFRPDAVHVLEMIEAR